MRKDFLWFGKYVAMIADGKHDTHQQNQAGRSGLNYIEDVCTSAALDDVQYGESGLMADDYKTEKEYIGVCGTKEQVNALMSRCDYLIGIIDRWLYDSPAEGLKMARLYMQSVKDMTQWQQDQLTEAEQNKWLVQSDEHRASHTDTRPRLFRSKFGYNRTKSNLFEAIDRAELYKSLICAGLFPEETDESVLRRKAALLGAFLFGDIVPRGEQYKTLTIAPKAAGKLAQFVKDISDTLKALRTDNNSVYSKAEKWFVLNTGKPVNGASLKTQYSRSDSDQRIDAVVRKYFSVVTD